MTLDELTEERIEQIRRSGHIDGLDELCDMALCYVRGREPVAWIEHHKGGDNLLWEPSKGRCSPLFTTPQPTYKDGLLAAAKVCSDIAVACRNTADSTFDLSERLTILAEVSASLRCELQLRALADKEPT